jgi:hypothetical protein
VLAALLSKANDDLGGASFVLLVALGTLGGLLIADATRRHGRERTGIAVAGTALVGATLVIALTAGDSHAGSPRARIAVAPLRYRFTHMPVHFFRFEFDRDIGLPSETTDWRRLLHEGGVEVGVSAYRLTLANRSSTPLTITDIRPEVTASRRVASGSVAYRQSQESVPLTHFEVWLSSARTGSSGHLRDLTVATIKPRAYFRDHYISLAPGELYEATIRVVTTVQAQLTYRWVLDGSTPRGDFTIRDPHLVHISGGSAEQLTSPTYVLGRLAFLRRYECPSIHVQRWSYDVLPESLPGC